IAIPPLGAEAEEIEDEGVDGKNDPDELTWAPPGDELICAPPGDEELLVPDLDYSRTTAVRPFD
ncbi:hypothetical protein A2U01_0085864, partial [Trifolium medium]|nr:hypothetical protein [Trifolium medium]